MFRAANGAHVFLYRFFGGRGVGTAKGVPVLLLTVAGRKSGRRRTTPVAYLETDGWLVAGTAGGMSEDPQWIRNLKANPLATIEIGRRKVAVEASVLEGAARDEAWASFLDCGPAFVGYEAKAGRVIPVARLKAREMEHT